MRNCKIIDNRSNQRWRFSFTGPFQGKEITWDAELITLARYARDNGLQQLRQFIDVADDNGGMRKLTVGLNLPDINQPAMLKTIIMIRQYKRLTQGRHEYGEIISFG